MQLYNFGKVEEKSKVNTDRHRARSDVPLIKDTLPDVTITFSPKTQKTNLKQQTIKMAVEEEDKLREKMREASCRWKVLGKF